MIKYTAMPYCPKCGEYITEREKKDNSHKCVITETDMSAFTPLETREDKGCVNTSWEIQNHYTVKLPMSKEEIIDKCSTAPNGKSKSLSLDNCYAAMDEYAKQEAIGFWEWVGECDFTYDRPHIYIERNPHGIKAGYYTKDQLYQQYLQSKQQ